MGTGDRMLTLSLCGDVMTGRGVDQILPYPGDPRLWEPSVADARGYVELAEAVNGPIPRPVDFSWPWGDALEVLADTAPDVRLVNLETAVTRRGAPAISKSVHYRMTPENVPCLSVAGPDACCLANNHVLDFGVTGLRDTLETLTAAGLPQVGAGLDARAAQRPLAVPVAGGGRVVVVSCGATSSGIPESWAAGDDRPGVDLLPDLSAAAAERLVGRIEEVRRPGDVVLVSLHWGSNWGYQVPSAHIGFAHRLVDGGVDVVFGHSSHHPRPVEVYRHRLVLYGCGDFIDDYEGIGGYQQYRDDLRLLHLVRLDPDSGRLAGLRMVPLQARRMRLHHACDADAEQLRAVLDRVGRRFGTRVDRAPDGTLLLRPERP